MKKYSRILIAAVLALASFSASAMSQQLTEFLGKISSSCTSFDYSYTMYRKETKVVGSGTVLVQGNAFYLKGNGLEMWCDGQTRWTVDRDAEEAVIEPVEETGEDFVTNPALLLTSLDDAFTESSSGTSKSNGKIVSVSVLSPISELKSSTDISQLKLYYIASTPVLENLEVKLNDGTVCKFSISAFKTTAKRDSLDAFRFDEGTLSDSYVITDLR